MSKVYESCKNLSRVVGADVAHTRRLLRSLLRSLLRDLSRRRSRERLRLRLRLRRFRSRLLLRLRPMCHSTRNAAQLPPVYVKIFSKGAQLGRRRARSCGASALWGDVAHCGRRAQYSQRCRARSRAVAASPSGQHRKADLGFIYRASTIAVIVRSYHVEYALTHRNQEAKQHWARLVLSWGTAVESLVAHGFAGANYVTFALRSPPLYCCTPCTALSVAFLLYRPVSRVF